MKDASAKLLNRASRAIHSAEALLRVGEPEFSVGRAYYAMFFCAEALLYEQGLRFHKHTAVHAAFGREFAKTGLLPESLHGWLLKAFNKRIEGDYGIEAFIADAEASELIEQATEFLAQTRCYLESLEA